jgi:hypothetical protein
MIVTFEYLTKTSLAESIGDFESVSDMLAFSSDVFILVIVEAIVFNTIRRDILVGLSIVDRQKVDSVIVKYLRLLIV